MDSRKVAITFSISDKDAELTDTLYLTPQEYNSMGESDIEELKQRRLAKHKQHLAEHAALPKMSNKKMLEGLKDQEQILVSELEILRGTIADIEDKINKAGG